MTLCALALLAAVGGGLGLALLAHEDLLGSRSYEELIREQKDQALFYQALMLAQNWASREYGGMPEEEAELLRKMGDHDWIKEDDYRYEILDEKGKTLYSSGTLPETEQELEYSFQSLSYEEFLAEGYDQTLREEQGAYFAHHYDNSHGGLSYTARNATLETPVTLKLFLAPGEIGRAHV